MRKILDTARSISKTPYHHLTSNIAFRKRLKNQLEFLNNFIVRGLKDYVLRWKGFSEDIRKLWCRPKIRPYCWQEMRMEAVYFFETKILMIDIAKEGSIETIYFPKLPICDYVSPIMKEEFLNNSDLTSNKAKVESLVNLQEGIILDMESESHYIDNYLYKKLPTL